jgi:hypothetical protein
LIRHKLTWDFRSGVAPFLLNPVPLEQNLGLAIGNPDLHRPAIHDIPMFGNHDRLVSTLHTRLWGVLASVIARSDLRFIFVGTWR